MSKETTKLRNAHWCDTYMTLNWNTCFYYSFDVSCMISIAFTFHNFGICFMNKATSILNSLFWRYI